MREKTRATTKAALRHTVGASYLEPWSPENCEGRSARPGFSTHQPVLVSHSLPYCVS